MTCTLPLLCAPLPSLCAPLTAGVSAAAVQCACCLHVLARRFEDLQCWSAVCVQHVLSQCAGRPAHNASQALPCTCLACVLPASICAGGRAAGLLHTRHKRRTLQHVCCRGSSGSACVHAPPQPHPLALLVLRPPWFPAQLHIFACAWCVSCARQQQGAADGAARSAAEVVH